MTRKFLGICALLVFCITSAMRSEQETNHWKTLAQVTYEKGFDEYGEIFTPKFNDDIQALGGEEISLKGYIIPFEGLFDPEEVILSALPIASCFFCGSGGPETVAKVFLSQSFGYTAKQVIVSGTLTLNNKNPDELMYILKNAKIEIP